MVASGFLRNPQKLQASDLFHQACLAVCSGRCTPRAGQEAMILQLKGKLKVGLNKYGLQVLTRNPLIRLVSRAGLEPATHWLKASCSTN